MAEKPKIRTPLDLYNLAYVAKYTIALKIIKSEIDLIKFQLLLKCHLQLKCHLSAHNTACLLGYPAHLDSKY